MLIALLVTGPQFSRTYVLDSSDKTSEIKIGRSPTCTIHLTGADRTISREHVVLSGSGDSLEATVLSTKNGIETSTGPVGPEGSARLSIGAFIALGGYQIKLQAVTQDEANQMLAAQEPLPVAPTAAGRKLAGTLLAPDSVRPAEPLLDELDDVISPAVPRGRPYENVDEMSSLATSGLFNDLVPEIQGQRTDKSTAPPEKPGSQARHGDKTKILPPADASPNAGSPIDGDKTKILPPDDSIASPRTARDAARASSSSPISRDPFFDWGDDQYYSDVSWTSSPVARVETDELLREQEQSSMNSIWLAFTQGLGLPAPPALDAARAEQVGKIVRELVVGLSGMLRTKRQWKQELNIDDRTQFGSTGSNPLKTLTPDECLSDLFLQRPGFMRLDEAVNEAIVELNQHEEAATNAVRAAIVGVLAYFDPPSIESANGGSRSRVFSTFDRAKFWNAFCAVHAGYAQDENALLEKVLAEHYVKV